MTLVVIIVFVLLGGMAAAAASADAISNIKANWHQRQWYKKEYETQVWYAKKRQKEIENLREQVEVMHKELHRHNTLDAWVATSEYEDEIEKLKKKVKSQALMIKNLDTEIQRLRNVLYPDTQ